MKDLQWIGWVIEHEIAVKLGLKRRAILLAMGQTEG